MGKLFDEAGAPLTPSHAVKFGRRYRYYVSKRLISGTVAEGKERDGWRLPAREIERIVGDAVTGLFADHAALADAVRASGMVADRVPGLLDAVARWRGEILDLIERVDLSADRIAIDLNLMPLTGERETTISHVSPAQIRRRGVEMRLVLEGAGTEPAKPDPALIKSVARAHRWFDDLVSGRAQSLGDSARAAGVSDRYVSHLMPLAFLAPEIVEAILAGTQPVDLTAQKLTKRTDLPLDWAEQKTLLGFD